MVHALVFVLATGFLLIPGTGSAKEKIRIGMVENVILLPWGIELPARIDTGASKSSLGGLDLKVDGEMAEFKLPLKYGGLQLRLPILEWRHVRSPGGRERRPVVEMELCLGSKRIRTKVNVTDRSQMKYPLIVGRNVLREDFVVDVKKAYVVKPDCIHESDSQGR